MALSRGQVLDAVLKADVGGSTEKCVLFVLDNYIRDHQVGWPTIKTIAEGANCCEQTARSAIRKLESLGLIESRPRRRTDGTSSSNEYAIKYEKLVPTPQDLVGYPPAFRTVTPQDSTPPLKRPSEAHKETEEPDGFQSFWLAYPPCPRRVDRIGSLKIWRCKNLEAKKDEILAGLELWRPVWKADDNKFVPLVTTFLNQGRWESDPGPPPRDDDGDGWALTEKDVKGVTIEQFREAMEGP